MWKKRLLGFLQLTRPANIVTSVADILLGFAASGAVVSFLVEKGTIDILHLDQCIWLILSTIGLYGGGVALNDVFDYELDQKERPERPLPSGLIQLNEGMVLGIFLLIGGILAANQVSSISALIAGGIAASAVWYDAAGKHRWYGPINMGICRGLNVLLGMSLLPITSSAIWLILIPIIYISGITTISRGEVHGENNRELKLGLGLYLIVFALIIYLSEDLLISAPYMALLGYFIFPPLFKAIRTPKPQLIGKAVKSGVIALIILDAALATGFTNWAYGLLILSLLPLSLGLAKLFAVT